MAPGLINGIPIQGIGGVPGVEQRVYDDIGSRLNDIRDVMNSYFGRDNFIPAYLRTNTGQRPGISELYQTKVSAAQIQKDISHSYRTMEDLVSPYTLERQRNVSERSVPSSIYSRTFSSYCHNN